ncbi:unnamed protein product, partial [marine sediment metagenome]
YFLKVTLLWALFSSWPDAKVILEPSGEKRGDPSFELSQMKRGYEDNRIY